jgi:seryl-tRNA synthetase
VLRYAENVIDIALLREQPELVRASQVARGERVELVDEALASDTSRRAAVSAYDTLRNEQKTLGKQIGPLQGAVKKGDTSKQAELDALMTHATALAGQVESAEQAMREADVALDAVLKEFSNVVHPDAPSGGEENFVVLEHVGKPRDFAAEGIAVKDHIDIGTALQAIDIERGAKVSGSRFYYLTGVGALLEFALIQLAMEQAQRNGFIPVIPPALVKPAAMEGTGFLGQAAENVYRLEADDMYLVGTSEVPLAAYHMDEILDADYLPRRYVGYSPCFRREAGSHGKDTKGIFRVHWFDKVEMFVFCDPEVAEEQHRAILRFEQEYLNSLELPYRVIDVAAGDLGSSAIRKFDCEAWIPSQERYRELTSTSNCTTFQSRRLRVRMKDSNGTRPLATLNGTLVAITRTIIAILENHQQADGSVYVPIALRPHLGGREYLVP